jgi:phage virion morphogenesis protein
MSEAGVIVHDDEVQRAFARLIEFAGHPRAALAAIGRYGVSSTRLRFRSQTDPDGNRWLPSQRVRKHGGQTLRLTSRLRNSITYNVTSSGVEWGTNVKYAARHQFSFDKVVSVKPYLRVVKKFTGKGKDRKLELGKPHFVRAHSARSFTPRRAFLGINAADRGNILKIISDHYEATVRG